MSENIGDHGALSEAYEKEDFVRVNGSDKTWLRIMSVGGLTLVATWVSDEVVESAKGEES